MNAALLRDQLELTGKLTVAAARLRREDWDFPAVDRLAAEVLSNVRESWGAGAAYKGQYVGVRLMNGNPQFGLFHEPDQERLTEIVSSAQEAAKAIIAYHRTHILSRPRYEIERQPFIGWEYEPVFETDSSEEAVEEFRASAPTFEGGDLRIWDRHEDARAAYLLWTPKFDPYGELISQSSRPVYLDQEIAAAAQRLDQREAQRERISVDRKMSL